MALGLVSRISICSFRVALQTSGSIQSVTLRWRVLLVHRTGTDPGWEKRASVMGVSKLRGIFFFFSFFLF